MSVANRVGTSPMDIMLDFKTTGNRFCRLAALRHTIFDVQRFTVSFLRMRIRLTSQPDPLAVEPPS
jgi:hypothetical protein